MGEDFRLSAFQSRALRIPEKFDLFLGGGRGGAKSFTLALLAPPRMTDETGRI